MHNLGNDQNSQSHALGERVKELKCLYSFSELIRTPGISMPEIIEESLKLLPPAWQYPQITCARIKMNDLEYQTENFRKTNWKLSAKILDQDEPIGMVEVFYLEERPECDEGPFLKEERTLINEIADRISQLNNRNIIQRSLKEGNFYFHNIFNQHNAIMLIIEPSSGQIVDANIKAVEFYRYSKDELTSMNIQEINKLSDEEVKEKHLQALRGERNHFIFEQELANHEIALVEVHSSLLVIKDQDFLLSVVHDLSERKKYEEKIRDLSRFPDENPSPVLRISKEGKILYANKSSADLLQFWGKSIGENIPLDWEKYISSSLDSDELHEVETLCNRKVLSFIMSPVKERGYVNAYGRDITDRKQKAEALQNSEENLRALFLSTPDYLLMIDKDLKIELSNRASQGLSIDDLIGKDIIDFLAEEEQSEIKLKLLEVLRSGTPVIYETQYNPPDGNIIYYETKAVRRTVKEEIVGLTLNTRDITERKKTEIALRENQKRYKKAQAMGHAGNWEYDPSTTRLWGSDETKRIFGFNLGREDFTIENVESCIPERERVHQALLDLMEHNQEYNIIFDILTFDKGVRKTIHSIAEAERDAQGNVGKITGVISDITIQKEVEQALHESEIKNRTYIEHAPLGIFVVDQNGKYIDVNPGACELLGYSRDEFLELSIPALSSNLEYEYTFKALRSKATIESDVRFESDMRLKKKDGSFVSVRLNAVSLPNGHFIGFCTDMSESEKQIKEIQNERDKAQNYLDIAYVMILTLNAKGEIIQMNNHGYHILGYEDDSLNGKNWFETCIPERYRKEITKFFNHNMGSDESFHKYYENWVLTKSGEERLIAWHNADIWDERRNKIGTISSGHDITDRRRSENLLNALNQASAAMTLVQTHEEIFEAIAEQLGKINISCMLFLTDEAQSKLAAEYMSYPLVKLKTVEKLINISFKNFSFLIDSVDVYREIVRGGGICFLDDSVQVVKQVLPKGTKQFAKEIVELMGVKKGIFAPLIEDQQIIGVFSIQADDLIQDDVAMTNAFVNGLAAAWKKATLIKDLENTLDSSIHVIAATVEVRDLYTAGHQTRVADLAVAIASELGLSQAQIEGIKMASIIHDLGKIQIPAEILSKPGKISDLEYEIIKTHPQVGYDLLKGIEFPWPIAEIIRQHHEKLDGSGYPQGIKGDEILIEARILAVSDIVEAMSSHRPYRPALGIEKALEEIRQEKGTRLDSDVVDACLKLFEQGFELSQK